MRRQASVTKDLLHDWVDEETTHLDVVASWESLCETYRVLEFTDPLSDTVKLEEFKWIIKQMNAFLTRIRSPLMSCKDAGAALRVLKDNLVPTGKVQIEGRRSLAFQKLRQRWVVGMMRTATEMMEMEEDYGSGTGSDGESC